MDIGQRIKAARIKKGLTQEELGQIIGVQGSAIAKYEKGRVVNIKRSILQKLAVALDLRGSDLVIENSLQETATLHARVLKDTELMISIEHYYGLPEDDQRKVRGFIDSLSKKLRQ